MKSRKVRAEGIAAAFRAGGEWRTQPTSLADLEGLARRAADHEREARPKLDAKIRKTLAHYSTCLCNPR